MFCIILYNFLPLILIFLDIVLFYLVIHSFCVYLFFYMLYLSIITDWLHYVLHGSRILPQKQTVRSSFLSVGFRLILQFLAGLGLPSGLFHSGFPTKTLNTFIVSPISATRSAHLNLPNNIQWTVHIMKHLTGSLLQPPVTSSHFHHSTFPFAYVVPKHPLNSEAPWNIS